LFNFEYVFVKMQFFIKPDYNDKSSIPISFSIMLGGAIPTSNQPRGIKGIVRILPRLDFNMDLLYSKKGSKIPSGNKVGNDFVKDRIIDLTYMEVPFSFKWLTRNQVNSMHIEAGMVYSRLIDQSITELFDDTSRKFLYASIVDNFEKDDLAFMGGVGFTWHHKWALHGRFMYSFTRFYVDEEFTQPQGYSPFALPVEFLRNYQVSLQLSYALF